MELAKARYVNVYKLMEFANNMKDKTIDANDIARFPWADVRENVHAHWIKHEDRECWYCSHCKEDDAYAYYYSEYNLDRLELQDLFCPKCGAQMDERSKDE